MERGRVTELHYITPIVNLKSIVERGIMSHNRAAALPHVSIADQDVQERRRGRRLPNGNPSTTTRMSTSMHVTL